MLQIFICFKSNSELLFLIFFFLFSILKERERKWLSFIITIIIITKKIENSTIVDPFLTWTQLDQT